MNDKEKLSHLEEIFDVDDGTLSPEMDLADIDAWDSLAAITLVTFVSETFNVKLRGAQIRSFRTVRDILDVMKSNG